MNGKVFAIAVLLFLFPSLALAQQARITIHANQHVREIPREIYGVNLEWFNHANGIWDVKANTVKPAYIDLLKDLQPSHFRYPGGLLADHYQWKAHVGPIDKRKIQPHGTDPGASYPLIGTDELAALSSHVGMQAPLLQTNIITGTPAEAGEWAAYTKEKNYGIPLWEIGNEQYLPQKGSLAAKFYAARVKSFAEAIHKADPSAQIMAVGGLNFGLIKALPDNAWNETLLKETGDQMNMLALHNAYAPVVFDERNLDKAQVYPAMLAYPLLTAQNLKDVAAQIKQFAPGKNIKLAVTEWGPLFAFWPESHWIDHNKTLGSALFVASTLNVFLRDENLMRADFFKFADPLFMGLVNYEAKPKPSYYAFQLYSKYMPERLVKTDVFSPAYDVPQTAIVPATKAIPYLDAVAAMNKDGRKLVLTVVNKNLKLPIVAALDIQGFTPQPKIIRRQLTGAAIDANNGPDLYPGAKLGVPLQASPTSEKLPEGTPGSIKTIEDLIELSIKPMHYKFAPMSVTQLEFMATDTP